MTNEGTVLTATEASKNLPVENGKGGTISYARIAQMNRDKLAVPACPSGSVSSGTVSNRGPPLAKQTSMDSSSQSQEDKRSVKHENIQQSSSGPVAHPSPKSPYFRDNRMHQNRHFPEVMNGHDDQHGYLNGNSGVIEKKDSNNDSAAGLEEDTEGFTEVIKHKPLRHDRHFRGSMRYGGSN